MGGLIRLMPVTAGCAIVGALSIAGIPPLNGFVSKWLLYQSAILGKPSSALYLIYAVIAIFMSTVTLAYFVKFLGTAYLGTLPERFAESTPPPKSMEIVQVFLAAGCLLLGIFPAAVVLLLLQVLSPALGLPAGIARGALGALPWMGMTFSAAGTEASAAGPLILALAFAACVAVAFGIYRSVRVASRPASIWNCGEVVSNESVRYRASSFYRPFRNLIRPLERPVRWPELPPPFPLFRGLDLDRWIYFPVGAAFVRVGRTLSRIHNGVPQFYLLWQVVGLVLSLLLVFWLVGGR